MQVHENMENVCFVDWVRDLRRDQQVYYIIFSNLKVVITLSLPYGAGFVFLCGQSL